jgi:site-specific DNA-methyltransferase (adenine-specific)
MIKLYNGDCLEVMDKLIKDGVKVDAIITDPPYGTTACKWDSVIPFDKMWERLNKLIKPNGAIVLFGSEPFSSALRMSNIKYYRYDWIWKKQPTMFQHSKNRPMQATENISVFSLAKWGHSSQLKEHRMNYYPVGVENSGIKKFHGVQGAYIGERPNQVGKEYMSQTGFPNNLIEIKREPKNVHPTQKPVALMEYLVKTYTNENETVLDFTMGSGTTGVACQHLNRNFIGIELDENYFKIAKERIEKEV